MLGLENEYLTGVLTSLMRPQAGWSTSVTMLRAFATMDLVQEQEAGDEYTYNVRARACS
jgi:hypothetical protein